MNQEDDPIPVINTVSKVPTGITGLDEITAGGLPRGRTTLILGAAGEIVRQERVLAVPMVIRKSPLREVRVIGDLSDREMAVRALGIRQELAGRAAGGA